MESVSKKEKTTNPPDSKSLELPKKPFYIEYPRIRTSEQAGYEQVANRLLIV